MPSDEKPPAFLLYVSDFTSDGNVEAMTTQEVGAYILLLCKAWKEEPAGSLPDDDSTLARWSRLTPAQWAKCRAAVLTPFRKREDGRLHQPRMQKEFAKLRGVRASRSQAAKRAADARWHNSDADASGMRDAYESHSERNADECLSSAITNTTRTHYAGAREPIVPDPEEQPEEFPPSIEHFALSSHWKRYRIGLDLDTQQRVAAAVTDESAWDEALAYWWENGYRGRSIGKIVTKYREILKERGKLKGVSHDAGAGTNDGGRKGGRVRGETRSDKQGRNSAALLESAARLAKEAEDEDEV
jgi:uncharacterized protein YdaU (DUF1376 family)